MVGQTTSRTAARSSDWPGSGSPEAAQTPTQHAADGVPVGDQLIPLLATLDRTSAMYATTSYHGQVLRQAAELVRCAAGLVQVADAHRADPPRPCPIGSESGHSPSDEVLASTCRRAASQRLDSPIAAIEASLRRLHWIRSVHATTTRIHPTTPATARLATI
jgi:hypothetical protein